MALYNYKCSACGASVRKILTPARALEPVGRACTVVSCAGTLERDQVGPSTQKLERLDNGLMPRAIERNADAERLFKERANKIPD